MGISISYVAVKGKSKEEIWREFSIQKKDEPILQLVPDRGDLIGYATGHGWYMLLHGGFDLFENKDAVERLSKNTIAVVAASSEQMMFSLVDYWSDENCKWYLKHEAKGKEEIEVVGDPPEPFEKLRNEALIRSSQPSRHPVDYFFDIPPAMFVELTGINWRDLLCVDPDAAEVEFDNLEFK